MGVWEGIFKGWEAADEENFRQEQLALSKKQDERADATLALTAKKYEDETNTAKINSLFESIGGIDTKRKSNNLSVKGDVVADLRNYLSDKFLAPYIAKNNPNILLDLRSAAAATHKDRVSKGANTTLSDLDKKDFDELYANINIESGENEALLREGIANTMLELELDIDIWKKYPNLYSKLEKKIKALTMPSANIEALYETPNVDLSEVEKAQKIFAEFSIQNLEEIDTAISGLENSDNLPSDFKQWLSGYALQVNSIMSKSNASKIAFAGGNNLDSLFAGRENLRGDPIIENFVSNIKNITSNIKVDMLGEQMGDGSYEHWNIMDAIYKTSEGAVNFGKNNPLSRVRQYYRDLGIKLIPEGTQMKILVRSGRPNAYTYKPEEYLMTYKSIKRN